MKKYKEKDIEKYERPVIKNAEDAQRIIALAGALCPFVAIFAVCTMFGIIYLLIKAIELILEVSLLPN